jgi:hypothetical protein
MYIIIYDNEYMTRKIIKGDSVSTLIVDVCFEKLFLVLLSL